MPGAQLAVGKWFGCSVVEQSVILLCTVMPLLLQGESSAGLRQGATSATSLLFNDLVNIIHEIRRANNDVLPFLFLENVCSMPKESFAFYERQLHRLMGAGYRCPMFGTENVVKAGVCIENVVFPQLLQLQF